MNLLKLMVIDDEPRDIQLLHERLVTDFPFFVIETAPTYTEGLEALKNHQHDAYIIDMYLDQGQSGMDLIKYARNQKILSPLFVVTGFVTEELEEELEVLGVAGVFSKMELLEDKNGIIARIIRYSIWFHQVNRTLVKSFLEINKLSRVLEKYAG